MSRRQFKLNKLPQSDIDAFLDGLQQGRKSLLMVTERYDFGTPEYKEASELVTRLVKLAQDVSGQPRALMSVDAAPLRRG